MSGAGKNSRIAADATVINANDPAMFGQVAEQCIVEVDGMTFAPPAQMMLIVDFPEGSDGRSGARGALLAMTLPNSNMGLGIALTPFSMRGLAQQLNRAADALEQTARDQAGEALRRAQGRGA